VYLLGPAVRAFGKFDGVLLYFGDFDTVYHVSFVKYLIVNHNRGALEGVKYGRYEAARGLGWSCAFGFLFEAHAFSQLLFNPGPGGKLTGQLLDTALEDGDLHIRLSEFRPRAAELKLQSYDSVFGCVIFPGGLKAVVYDQYDCDSGG